MIYIPGDSGKKIITKLWFLLAAVFILGLYGLFFLWYFQEIASSSEPREPGMLACFVVAFLFLCAWLIILYIANKLTGFEVDGSGIRVFLGKKTKKTAMWQEFRYVGELNARLPYSSSPFPRRIILCSPEQPWLVYGYTDVYSFRGKGAIVIDYTPETEQIMKPYYKGTLSADE